MARLHADSWRRHYRGAYADSFLDGDVHADRLRFWTARLSQAEPPGLTILAEDAGPPSGDAVGFVHVVFEGDPGWGALVDNLHVAHGHQRRGIGSRLLACAAQAAIGRQPANGMYLWVLEQNAGARAFYEALGATCAEAAPVTAPGGVAGRLNGAPQKLRYAWAQPGILVDRL